MSDERCGKSTMQPAQPKGTVDISFYLSHIERDAIGDMRWRNNCYSSDICVLKYKQYLDPIRNKMRNLRTIF